MMKPLRSHNEINGRLFFNQCRAPALGHAAHVAENELRLAALELREQVHLADGFLFSQVAHAAGIEQNHVGFALGTGDGVTAFAVTWPRPLRCRARSSGNRRF